MSEPKERVIWSHDAEEELLSIWRYGADEWSPEIADNHLFEIESSCERLLDEPMLGKSRDELAVGMRSIFVRPHVIFYQISKTTIEIVRVLHQRQEIEKVSWEPVDG